MKRTLLILSLITLTATFSRAQYTNKIKTMIYGEAGLNIAGFYQTAASEKSLRLGTVQRPMLSLYVKVKYPTLVGFEGGVVVSQTGTRPKDKTASLALFEDTVTSKAILNSAYGFIDAIYFFQLQGDDNSISAGVGLYGGYTFNGDRYVGSEKNKLNIDEMDWNRFDMGLQLKTAYNLHDFITLGMQYRIGFVPIIRSIDIKGDPNNLRTSVFTLTAGLRLAQFITKQKD